MRVEEVVLQRRQTDEFVRTNPSKIRFKRELRQRNSRGGLDTRTSLTPVQTVRFVRANPRIESTTVGQTKRCYDKLVGRVDTDMQAGDEFEFEGEEWKILKTLVRPYELTADVELKGDG